MLASGESSTVEFKLKAPRPAKVAERICGMANTRTGGTIIFGAADETSEIVGISALSQSIDIVLRATRMIKLWCLQALALKRIQSTVRRCLLFTYHQTLAHCIKQLVSFGCDAAVILLQ